MPRFRRLPAVALSAAAVSALTLSLVGVPAQAGSAQKAPAVSQAATIGYAAVDHPDGVLFPNEPTSVTGKVGNKFPRTIKLEAKSGSRYTVIASTKSMSNGTFKFDNVSLPKSTTVRVTADEVMVLGGRTESEIAQLRKSTKKAYDKAARADKVAKKKVAKAAKKVAVAAKKASKKASKKNRKAHKKNRKAHKKALTHRAKVTIPKLKSTRSAYLKANALHKRKKNTVVYSESKDVDFVVETQKVRIADMPAIAQPGASAASPSDNTLVSVGVTPGRAGRTVTLQVNDNGMWHTADAQKTDRSGHAVFTAKPGATYRAQVGSLKGVAGAPEAVTDRVVARSFNLDFEDTFSGSKLDSSKWTVNLRPRGTGSRGCSYTDDSALSVGGGVLSLGIRKDTSMGNKTCAWTDDKGVKHQLPYMVNSQISTNSKYTMTHGFMAARVKVQKDRGMHSAFWANPTNNITPLKPELGVEIDTMEYFGDSTKENGIASFIHYKDADGIVQKDGRVFDETTKMKDADKRLSDSYHVYSVEWTPKEYIFRVDGREHFRTASNVSQSPQVLMLSMLSSDYELPYLKNIKDTAKVDWVRTWK